MFNFSLLIGAAMRWVYWVTCWRHGSVEQVWNRRNTVVLWTLLGSLLFQVLARVPETFSQYSADLCADEHVFLWLGGGEVCLSG